MVTTLRAILASATALLCAGTMAAPITLSFSGIAHSYTPLGGVLDYAKVNEPIYGAIVYDVARADNFDLSYATNGNGVTNTARTTEGCKSITNGSCSQNFGSGRPVVIGYRLVSPWGIFTELPSDFYSDSYFGLGRDFVNDGYGYDVLSLSRHDERTVYDLQAQTFEYAARQIGIGLVDFGFNGRLFGNIEDLGQLPDSSVLSLPSLSSPTNIVFTNASCQSDVDCGDAVPGYGARASFFGQFTWAELRRGVHLVPEPGTLALVLFGLFCLRAFELRHRNKKAGKS